MKVEEQIRKIKRIVKNAVKDFNPAKWVYVKNKKGEVIGVAAKETKKQEVKRLEKNFYVYGKALEKICELLNIKGKPPKIE